MDLPARRLIGYVAGEFENDAQVKGRSTLFSRIMSLTRGPSILGATALWFRWIWVNHQARGMLFIHPQAQFKVNTSCFHIKIYYSIYGPHSLLRHGNR